MREICEEICGEICREIGGEICGENVFTFSQGERILCFFGRSRKKKKTRKKSNKRIEFFLNLSIC